MKKINYLVLFVFALTMSVSSCKKDESYSYEGLSNLEKNIVMLTAEPWIKSYNKESGDSVALFDCVKDDVYTFLTDGTVLYQVDELICGGEINGSGTWSMSGSNGGLLTLDGINWGIVITEDELKLVQYYVEDDSSFEMIFIHL